MPSTAKKPSLIVGGILSGGKSTRMGRPKELVLLSDGRPMISHVVAGLQGLVPHIVVAGPKLDAIGTNEQNRISFVSDLQDDCGPIAGVQSILSSGLATGYLIAGCDQPLLTAALLRELLLGPPSIPCFFTTGVVQPLPGYYPSTWLREVESAINRGHHSLRKLIAQSGAQLIRVSSEQEHLLRSFNSPADLAELHQIAPAID